MLVQIIEDTHLAWLLEKGKELERACEFSMALKFYFAGKMYFQRQERQAGAVKAEQKQLRDEFGHMYRELLPMTNAEVICLLPLHAFARCFALCLFCLIVIFRFPPRPTQVLESPFTTRASF
jgi:hypothetical protein